MLKISFKKTPTSRAIPVAMRKTTQLNKSDSYRIFILRSARLG